MEDRKRVGYSPSPDGAVQKKAKKEPKNERHVQLSDSIWIFFDQKLSEHADIYNGKQLHGHFSSLPIVVKLVDEDERNKKEARILSKLNHHGNVISLIETSFYDNGLENYIYIAMDECHKENLREFIENRNEKGIPFDQNFAMEIVRQIITGLEYIHDKNIAHLDLKPDNILFTLDQKMIKIADFGLSEEICGKKMFVKHQFGTNGFRPPESFGKSYISLGTDIFSLGALFCFILSNGKNPFGEDLDSQNMNAKNGKIDLSWLLVPNCETTKHLIKCMLELKRNNRPTISKVSEHPCWSGKEIDCDFDYKSMENSDSDSCDDEEEPLCEEGDFLALTTLLKKYQKLSNHPGKDIYALFNDHGVTLNWASVEGAEHYIVTIQDPQGDLPELKYETESPGIMVVLKDVMRRQVKISIQAENSKGSLKETFFYLKRGDQYNFHLLFPKLSILQ